MSVCVFLGPTLSHDQAREIWEGPRYLPPVRQGELYAASRQRPLAIGIVDGYFRGVPAVWHKEILWAMTQGIHVVGAASMGALRASELHTFGMRGVGDIFEAYASGEYEDDDEVAVLHGPAELDYPTLSDAMVSIRATIARAQDEGIVDLDQAVHMLEVVKRRPFGERSYRRMIEELSGSDAFDATTLAAFSHWLPAGQVDQKREDAIAMLRWLRDNRRDYAQPLRVHYRFAHTEAWQDVIEREQREAIVPPLHALALEAAKLDGAWQACRSSAILAHALAFRRVGGERAQEPAHYAEARDMLRREHDLWTAADFTAWKTANGLDEPDFEALVATLTRLHAVTPSSAALDPFVIQLLQAEGAFAHYLTRARTLQEQLQASDASQGSASTNRVSEREHTARASEHDPSLADLLAASSGEQPPSSPQALEQRAVDLGFESAAEWHAAWLRQRRLPDERSLSPERSERKQDH